MRKQYFLIIYFLFFIFNTGFNQIKPVNKYEQLKRENEKLKNEISALKNDTAYLRQKIDTFKLFYDTKTYSINKFDNSFRVEITSCKGDTGSHIVKIRFAVTNNKSAQIVCLFADSTLTYAIDDIGNRFQTKECSIGFDKGEMPCAEVPSGALTKGYIIYSHIIAGCDNLNFAKIHITYGDSGGTNISRSDIIIRNIKIRW